jgi:hypothetical protein
MTTGRTLTVASPPMARTLTLPAKFFKNIERPVSLFATKSRRCGQRRGRTSRCCSFDFEGKPVAALSMTMLPPAVGSQVAAFGYPRSTTTESEEAVLVSRKGATSVGRVVELHLQGRDRSQLPWPCFRMDAHIGGGMSGGPVFNDKGELCGLMCTSFGEAGEHEGHLSYVTLLWPMLGLTLDFPRVGYPAGKYALIELARANMIHARHWDHVSVTYRSDGEPEVAAFRPE